VEKIQATMPIINNITPKCLPIYRNSIPTIVKRLPIINIRVLIILKRKGE
jgi:hypothetical protein